MKGRCRPPFITTLSRCSCPVPTGSAREPGPSRRCNPSAMSAKQLSIVIPAFNERHRIGATLALLTEYLYAQPWTWEIRVIDDGSTDGTGDAVRAFSNRDPHVQLQ